MADPFRTMIVDDEPAAVRRLTRLCEPIDAIRLVATAGDGNAALAILDKMPIDLLLLDIEMPGLSGMALAERLVGRTPAPAIVFVTAFERFAIAAFAVDAVGYLLKPVDPEKLSETIARLRDRATPVGTAEPAVFWVPYRNTLLRIAAGDITHITGEDDYARLHCDDRSHLIAERLYAIEQRLGTAQFLRIHRSTLVNRDRVTALANDAGQWFAVTQTGDRLPIGRSHLPAVREQLSIRR